MSPNEFIAIIDREGDLQETCAPGDDTIWSLCRGLDGKFPDCAPHRPVLWTGERWREWG